jgi:triacylglycerol lipase
MRRSLLLLVLLALGCGEPPVVSVPGDEADGGPGDLDAGSLVVNPELPVDGGATVALPDGGTATKKGPPYPIVLAHGFFGFDTFAGLDFLTYFFEVKEALEADGEVYVFTPTVDPFNDSATRSAQLEARVEAILAQTGHAKVNLFGHSQGGLDSRMVAHRRPELVASVTTFSTPHRGTPVSDLVANGDGNPQADAVVDAIVNLAARPLWSEADAKTSITKALRQFSSESMREFNAQFPDAPGVAYFSYAGRSALRYARDECETGNGRRPDFVREFDDTLDPLTSMLSVTGLVISPNPFSPKPHDGLVPVTSAKWGTFLGCVPADHLDEIGQIGGLPPGLGNDWRHKPFYVKAVRLLRAGGF